MRRREFIALLGLIGVRTGCPHVATAQEPNRQRRIGVLIPTADDDPDSLARAAVFQSALRNLGWVDGQNITIAYRWPGSDSERIRTYAAELVAFKPDVILASTALALLPLKQATSTIPIVFTNIYDAMAAGFVASMTHPGGNITGFTLGEFSIGGKMLQLLKDVAPRVRRVGVVLNPDQSPQIELWRAIEAVSPSIGVHVTEIRVRNGAEIQDPIESFAREPDGALVVLPNPVTLQHRGLIIELADRLRLPAVYGFRIFCVDGGLLSYGTDLHAGYEQAAVYIDRILHGAKPTDLPIQQATKFQLVINTKTAKALALDVPVHLQQLADEVIE
jgi:putative tryptophan/tyrosine transport system substrate-binding protein